MFDKVDAADFPSREREVIEFWRDQDVFKQSLEQRTGAGEYVFYDGPPFATGLPHYGHLLASTIKDVVPRYQTMRGRYVERVFGWDCHGLPVENEMENELGINSKREIEEYGVDRFNEACRGIVLRYTEEWRSVVERLGRWVDFDNGYRTMDRDYMESIWWVFKSLWDKDLIYEGDKIMWYCPRCATPLANFEVNQGYKSVDDPAITVRFRVLGRDGETPCYFLAWTTTPWTLPANLALTVGPDINYVEVKDGDEHYILAEELMSQYWPKALPEVVRQMPGTELLDMRYEPLFGYFADLAADGAFRVIPGDFVTTTAGTGIVHTAPGFGEDDYNVGKANNVPVVCPVNDEGQYSPEITEYEGRFVKDCDKEIIQRLKSEGKLVHRSMYRHDYPHCWRCDAPLLNKTIATWFVRVEQIKDKMIAANQQIHWVPGHLQNGRFGKWLENARDWAISRNRYWGCPLPIWRNKESGETVCVGSINELEDLCGHPVPDIHKHFVDDIELGGADGKPLTRVPEVLDCWFESGSMPYAQHHYPFANQDRLEANFPADFIAEGLDQTRGWFYTLVVLGAALFDKPPFHNVVVNGLILAEDGEKMSKRKKNYPDPAKIIDSYGADALRLYLLSSPVVRGEDFCFSEDGVKETMRGVLLPLWNSYSFFVMYANVDGWQPAGKALSARSNPLDQWILGRLEEMVEHVRQCLDGYDLQGAATGYTAFIDNLTNWYIRRSRRRFWKSQNDDDKNEAYETLYHVLLTFCKIAAPQIPFVTETIYRNLRTSTMPESVHLCDYPDIGSTFRDAELDQRMERVIKAVSLARHLRGQARLRIRQPLPAAILVSANPEVRADLDASRQIVQEELNVKNVVVEADETRLVELAAKANFRRLGPRFGPRMKAAAAAIEALDHNAILALQRGETVVADVDGGSESFTLEDVDVRRTEKGGMAVANEGDVTVALDCQLTPELRQEGMAREVVNRIQGIRRDIDLDVQDRIILHYNVPDPVAVAMSEHRDYISSETLATEFCRVPSLDAATTDIHDHPCQFKIELQGG